MLILRAENLVHTGVAHAFFGRKGGVSEGIYASLNCGPGSKDAPDAVQENRSRALGALCPDRAALVTLYQTHGAEAVTVNAPWETAQSPKVDAMVTDRPGLALGILTADCAPVLLCDGKARVVGAAHAGWNGAQLGIIESVVAAMVGLGAKRGHINAAIGPCIGQSAYEVGPEFEAHFRTADPANVCFFIHAKRRGHWRFDLPAFIAGRLARAGVADVRTVPACTYTNEQDFFSYRRATHRQEPDYGRELSAIMLAP